jgi:hypothetical protein
VSKDDAIALIKSKKREAFFPEVNFDEALTAYESLLSIKSIQQY